MLPNFPSSQTVQAENFRKKVRKAAGLYLAAVLIVAAFLWGFHSGASKVSSGYVGSATGPVEIVNTDQNLAKTKLDFHEFWTLWQTVKERYVKQPVDERKMFYGAMAGVVASLGDPHSDFFDPDANKSFQQELNGKFDGIGAEIGIKKGSLVIIAPLPDSPAEKAGLKAGDKIVAIDGVDTTGMPIDAAVSRIRGDLGTKVKLHILRDGFDKPKVFEIVRGAIVVQSVKLQSFKSPKGKRLADIQITNFNADTAGKFIDTVSKLKLDQTDGLILDLRNDPGGYLDAAISILGEWVPDQIVVSERYSDGSTEEHRASGEGRLKDMKTLILVNGGSASASEITAGALQDYGKAKLLGTQTFGKGSVQDLIPFRDGSSVKLTIAEWLTPKGKNINENGITPDYKLTRPDAELDSGKDSQLDAAKAWFDGVTPPVESATSTAS